MFNNLFYNLFINFDEIMKSTIDLVKPGGISR